jgi:hypothetical protein
MGFAAERVCACIELSQSARITSIATTIFFISFSLRKVAREVQRHREEMLNDER